MIRLSISVEGKTEREFVKSVLAAKEIGIETIRKECVRFHGWIKSLEALRPSQ